MLFVASYGLESQGDSEKIENHSYQAVMETTGMLRRSGKTIEIKGRKFGMALLDTEEETANLFKSSGIEILKISPEYYKKVENFFSV